MVAVFCGWIVPVVVTTLLKLPLAAGAVRNAEAEAAWDPGLLTRKYAIMAAAMMIAAMMNMNFFFLILSPCYS
jgi:hypothetical protein